MSSRSQEIRIIIPPKKSFLDRLRDFLPKLKSPTFLYNGLTLPKFDPQSKQELVVAENLGAESYRLLSCFDYLLECQTKLAGSEPPRGRELLNLLNNLREIETYLKTLLSAHERGPTRKMTPRQSLIVRQMLATVHDLNFQLTENLNSSEKAV